MPLFRVDKREFADGDIMEGNPISYYDANNFSDTKRNIENILNECSAKNPSIPHRNKSLFIFNELYDAVKFWVIQTNSLIYEVEGCDGTTIHFRGDMNITDFMLHISDPTLLSILAEQYWQRIHTYKPCIEMQLNRVRVVRKLTLDESQRKAAFQEYYDGGKRVESVNFYKSILPIL